MELLDFTRPRAGYLHERLVGLHLGKCLMFGDIVTWFDLPGDQFSFGDSFPQVGKKELGFVSWLLDCHWSLPGRSSGEELVSGWGVVVNQ